MAQVLQFLYKLSIDPSPRRGRTNDPTAFSTKHFKTDLETVESLALQVNTTIFLESFHIQIQQYSMNFPQITTHLPQGVDNTRNHHSLCLS